MDSPHLLTFHTSCDWRGRDDNEKYDDGAGDGAPPHHGSNFVPTVDVPNTTHNSSNSTIETSSSDLDLTVYPMVCDLLLLPEIPSSNAGHHQQHHDEETIRLTRHVWNPCGTPNVLILKDTAMIRWQKVLLSLTSCGILMDDDADRLVAVDPTPSTFAFDLLASPQTDLHVAMAMRMDASLPEVEYKHEEADEVLLDTMECKHPPLGLNDILSYDSNHHDGLGHTSSSSVRLDKELEALARVQEIMDRDSANLDRLLHILLLIGLGLFMALVWSLCQLHYSRRYPSSQDNKLCESAQRKIRQQSELSRSPLMTGKRAPGGDAKHHQFARDILTPRVDNRSRSRIDLLPTNLLTPTRLDFSTVDTITDEKCATGRTPPATIATLKSTTTTKEAPTFGYVAPPQNPHNPFAYLSQKNRHSYEESSVSTTTTTRLQGQVNENKIQPAQQNPHNPFAYLASRGPPNDTQFQTPASAVAITNVVSPASQEFMASTTRSLRKSNKSRRGGGGGVRKIIKPQSASTSTKMGPLFADSSISSKEPLKSQCLDASVPKMVCATPGSADSFVEDYW